MKKETTLTVPRENARHGSIILPVNSYHCFVPETYTELALHWHEEMEITLVRKGTSDYKVGKSIFRTEEGDMLLIPPYCVHSASEIPGEWVPKVRTYLQSGIYAQWRKDISRCRNE